MLKTLMRSVREYKKPAILTPVFIAGEVIIECLIPFVTALLVNEIQNDCTMQTILRYGLILIVMAGLSLLCGAMAGRFAATAACGFAKNLRHDMFGAIQDYSFSNIDKFSTSSLVTRMTTDVSNVQMAFMMIIRTAVRCPMMLVFALIMAIITSPKMSIAFAVIIPILAIGHYQRVQT